MQEQSSGKEQRSAKERRTVGQNEMNEFLFEYSSKNIKTKVHDHSRHIDTLEAVSELEKNALLFLKKDCDCYNEETLNCDEDLMCLYHAVHRFMETGGREDAFDVYYCYVRMYFEDEKCQEARKLLEMLSNFENNASALVLKHRDHYSHSVYVFLIGLAIYHNNANYRKIYAKTYFGTEEGDLNSALHFLKYWGLSALFHDVGYPFEIPFEQIKSYFRLNEKCEDTQIPFVAFRQTDLLFDLRNLLAENGIRQGDMQEYEYNECFRKIAGKQVIIAPYEMTIADVIAYHINRRLKDREYPGVGDKETYIKDILLTKPVAPDAHNYYMDHAVFSSTIMFRKLLSIYGVKNVIDSYENDRKSYYGLMDALTAIVMHNSLFKFKLRRVHTEDGDFKRTIEMAEHPLAYLLMLCDELQCADRRAFGKDSKKELHAWNCEFDFSEDGTIRATYLFDVDKEAVSFDNNLITNVRKGTFKKMLLEFQKNDEIVTDGKKVKAEKDVYLKKSDEFNPEPFQPDSWTVDADSYGGDHNIFYKDIAGIVNLKDLTDGSTEGLRIGAKMSRNNRFRNSSLSNVRLINLYEMAEKLYKETGAEGGDFGELSLARQLSYIQTVKKIADYFDEIGVFYTDEAKCLAERHYRDFTLNEKRYLISLEAEREKDEEIQMLQGGITDEYLNSLNENPANAAEFFRNRYAALTKPEEGGIKADDEEDLCRFERIALKTDALIRILDEEFNIYYYPGKNLYEIDYTEESGRRIENEINAGGDVNYCPDRVIKKDLNGKIIRKYTQDEFVYEDVIDDLFAGEDNPGKRLYLVHIKECYRPYPLVGEDNSGDNTVLTYALEQDNRNAKLRLEVRSFETEKGEYEISTRLCRIPSEEDATKERIRLIDRTTYYFEKNENGDTDYNTIYFRQIPEGCVELMSFFQSSSEE